MSPRAAWRLESWGFQRAYDYVAGKQDWLSFGLPYEGTAVLAESAITREVPTCGLRDTVSSVRGAIEESPFGVGVALNDEGVVLGLVRRKALDASDDTMVEEVMREGPTTVRPSEDLAGLLERMEGAGVDAILVTSSDGKLLGILERKVGERRLEEGSPG